MPKDIATWDLYANQLTGPLPDITACANLSYADFSKNAFTGGLPESFGEAAASLNMFDISYNQLSGRINNTDWNMPKVTYLSMSHNGLTGMWCLYQLSPQR